jgi:hypothetical protein
MSALDPDGAFRRRLVLLSIAALSTFGGAVGCSTSTSDMISGSPGQDGASVTTPGSESGADAPPSMPMADASLRDAATVPDGVTALDAVSLDVSLPDAPSGPLDAPSESGQSDASTSSGVLAAKPLMGWSTWSTFEEGVSETIVEGVADAVASELLSSGYEYINIDDGWYNGFDTYGRRQPDLSKFPDGVSGVATYVHGKGLKIGIYIIPGLNDIVYNANSPIYGTTYHAQDIVSNPSLSGNTDQSSGQTAKQIDYTKPGAVEYIESYANLVASWGVDYIKFDFVGPGGGGGVSNNVPDLQQWRAALDKTGRQVWMELSNNLSISDATSWKEYSNGWRIQNDVECYCSTLTNWEHVVRNINSVQPWVQYAGPGGWNDLDSTEIGNGSHDGLTTDERQTAFSFWSISAAPLSLGSDPRSLDPTDLAILTNKEVIAVDQAGVPAKPVSTASTSQVWYAKNPGGSFTVGLFNFGASTATVTAKWSDVGAASSMNVRDVVSQTNLGTMSASFSASLATHASRLLKLTP